MSASQLSAEQQNHRLVGFKGSKSSLAEVQKERHQLDSMFRMLDVKESILQSAILLPFNIVEVLEKSGKELGSCLGLKLLLRDQMSTNKIIKVYNNKKKFKKEESKQRASYIENLRVCLVFEILYA